MCWFLLLLEFLLGWFLGFELRHFLEAWVTWLHNYLHLLEFCEIAIVFRAFFWISIIQDINGFLMLAFAAHFLFLLFEEIWDSDASLCRCVWSLLSFGVHFKCEYINLIWNIWSVRFFWNGNIESLAVDPKLWFFKIYLYIIFRDFSYSYIKGSYWLFDV